MIRDKLEKIKAFGRAHPQLLSAPDEQGFQPYYYAIICEQEQVLRFLIDHGVDILIKTERNTGGVIRRDHTHMMRNETMRARVIRYALWKRQLSFMIVVSLMNKKDLPHTLFRCENMVKVVATFF